MKKVYIVDDDKGIIESISMVLEANEYEVRSQTDGENLIENLNAYEPNVIILDVMFPENPSGGFDMARDIRKNAATEKTPILMLSAINEKGVYAGTFSNKDRDDAWLPVDEFIEKPIAPAQLLEKVRNATAQ